MADVVNMPRLSDTMEEGTVAKWHKKVGDKVSEGDLLAEIETDKATMDFEAFQEGILLHIGIDEGETAPVDSILAILGEEGEDISDLISGKKPSGDDKEESKGDKKSEKDENSDKESKEEEKEEIKKGKGEEEDEVKDDKKESGKNKSDDPEAKSREKENFVSSDSRLKVSPLARKLAEEKGINVSEINGSGEGGRIIKRDIDNFKSKSSAVSSPASPSLEDKEIAVSQMRKTIAKRLSESKFTAPHFYLTMDIDMENAIEARSSINETGDVKISFNDLVIKAAAFALKKHPKINASWQGDKIKLKGDINIGVAVAVEEGLLVPVVRNADQKGMATINNEVKEFAAKARDKKLQPSDWEGNTFTISNLGMFGIEEFTAIINSPDSCIMAVGAIKAVPVVKNGAVVPGNVMRVTLSCDHRVVDGATGAEFLQTFKGVLENPLRMLI